MTPAQKAKELVEKFREPYLALICVEEILQELCEANEKSSYNNLLFWQQVAEALIYIIKRLKK